MSIQAGLVGLPNVGKSTLFNALTKSCVPAENYPFCTIEPHVAITQVPDDRIEKLVHIYGSQKIIAATQTFVDIAGLVKGAAAGEGLGNQFLNHIRDVDLVLHVLRCFDDGNIIRTGSSPVEDYETIMAELMLKDVEVVDKRLAKLQQLIKAARMKPAELKELQTEEALMQKIKAALEQGDARAVKSLMTPTQAKITPLLAAKEFLIIANVSENELDGDAYKNNPNVLELVKTFGADRVIPVCAKAAGELARLSPEEAQEFATMLGMSEDYQRNAGLKGIIRKSYEYLGLITFFTCGPKEVHAWPIKKGISVRAAAGEIHSDLERGFICAEVFNSNDLFEAGSEAKLRATGKLRTEGQDYIVQDGDVLNIKFNV